MVSAVKQGDDVSSRVFDLVGLSTDTKPTTYQGVAIGNGSTFYEMNTGVLSMFNETTKTWITQ